MSGKLTTLEEFMRKYINNQSLAGRADSFDTYKHKNGINYNRAFQRAAESLYSDKKRNLSSYGQNKLNISNKGLQNSGYARYVDDRADDLYNRDLSKLESARNEAQYKALGGYASYLEGYEKSKDALKNSVASHLISSGIANLDEAVSYAISRGLGKEDAIAIGHEAYSINKQRIFNDILSQVASLGLDRDGAVMLAEKMGLSTQDAHTFGDEIEEMLKHYGSISKDYLEYLEQQSNKTTNTFN